MFYYIFLTDILLLACFIWIGLSLEELERLASLGTSARKTARRDIANVVSVLTLFTILTIYVYLCMNVIRNLTKRKVGNPLH